MSSPDAYMQTAFSRGASSLLQGNLNTPSGHGRFSILLYHILTQRSNEFTNILKNKGKS
jgi:hypothetical protein